MKFLVALTLLFGTHAFAAAAGDRHCQSDLKTVTADLEVSIVGERVTVTMVKGGQSESTSYFTDSSVSMPEDRMMMVQLDPAQSDLQPLAGSFPSVKQEFILSKNQKKIYDLGFVFLGRTFLCKRN